MTEMNAEILYEFFLICTPGLEDLLERELRAWGISDRSTQDDAGIFKKETGGISIKAKLADGFELNRVLKSPNRILLRLFDFGCRDFPKFYKKFAAFPWENWLSAETPVVFSAATTESRLKIKKRIEETAAEALAKRRKTLAHAKGSTAREPIEVYIRFAQDVCTVSLDTSGEILHKRSFRPLSAVAPLRESLAASLLLLMEQHSPPGTYEVFDPMMGSGTFLLEGALLGQRLKGRRYAFENFAQTLQPTPPVRHSHVQLMGFRGLEVNEKTLAAAKENFAHLQADFALTEPIQAQAGDFFLNPVVRPASQKRWVVANPPYGERLAIVGPLNEYYEKLMAGIESALKPDLVCLLLPDKVHPARLKRPSGWKLLEERKFLNGGLPVAATVFSG